MTLDMSQPPGYMRKRDFRSQASLHPIYAQIGSDDPSIIEEAQNLLSRFMGHSSHETQGSKNENKATSRKISNLGTETGTRSVDDCQVVCLISDDSTPESMPDKHAVSTARQHPALHPPLRSSRAAADTGSDDELDTVLPTTKRKQLKFRNTPQVRQASYSPRLLSNRRSPARNNVDVPGIRRSMRSRTGPANYYENLNLFNFESEEDPYNIKNDDIIDSPAQSRQCHASARSCDLSAPPYYQDHQLQYSIIYSSATVQILRAPFTALDDFKDISYARYRPERNPADYAKGLKEEDLVTGKILHFDFDQKETSALLNLLSFCGCQWTYSPEIAPTDQLIKVVSTNMHSKFFKKVSSILNLSNLLSTEDVSDTNALLLKILTSKPDTRKLRRARRLAMRLLESQDQHSYRSFSTSSDQPCYNVEELHRLSTYLSFASVLGRRQCTDIETFLADAVKGYLPSAPSIVKAAKSESSSSTSRKAVGTSGNLNRLLQDREMGCLVNRKVSSCVLSNLRLSKTWKGASNDVIVLAWSPDGTRFAAGATAQCDEHNMEYNRGNNLILGDLATNSLEELPDHCIPRPTLVSRGAVSDHRLFMSVTACQWFEDALYTASYDNTVKLWKFPNQRASCYQTLAHDSKVQVMARSNFDKDLLATGTQSIWLWKIDEPRPNYLDLPRQRSKRDIELVPTSLAWGTTSMTRAILIAGMSEKGDGVPQNGLLGGWHINEASATPIQLLPNSQNIFDVKWHPSLPLFATASSTRGGGTTLLSSKSTSCTDGITYVWDNRNPDTVLHRLQHGDPLNQIDETLPREQADVGVRLALWGSSVNQFYTGASDGTLKNWNILRSPDDALVQDIASFGEEIMCGAFSPDKSDLLIGDAAGGLHLLSPQASTNESLSFIFKRASQLPHSEYDADCESGVMAARKALSTGRLVRHPIYGVGQGPRYNGPYAAWARPNNTPEHQLGQTGLREEWQLRQLDGGPPALRSGLNEQLRKEVECQRQLAYIRNAQHVHKRKRADFSNAKESRAVPIDLYSDDDNPGFSHAPVKSKRLGAQSRSAIIAKPDIEIIDLTGDSDIECGIWPNEGSPTLSSQDADIDLSGFDPVLTELEDKLEDDHWWPPSGFIDPNLQNGDV
ncbi:WD repeat protein [Aspergillus alliaceus]|uniref:WD repeat protein n=1 Tax=Petromyces alliaceus TaxID=209559 RepID=UPI0012A4B2CA|nr:uncharacterized protein BDW43DRAFT_272328 [Aspergillus alliaceus]KAB8234630.1 hypothetical protein BDW43DRAFT_272328 [Aspergillus alliaceus]